MSTRPRLMSRARSTRSRLRCFRDFMSSMGSEPVIPYWANSAVASQGRGPATPPFSRIRRE